MWCPSATLSVWANAWLAGRAAPDDVLDALSRWAPIQSVAAYDAVAAGSVGLPWPGVPRTGAVSLLQTLRCTAGRQATTNGRADWPRRVRPVLPVPGDVRGLPPGTQFERDALATGEAVIVAEPDGSTTVGLVPEFADEDPETGEADTLCWTVHALPTVPIVDDYDLGEAEYALRSAVRSAVDVLNDTGFDTVESRPTDPHLLIEQLVESTRQHRIPDHAPPRAVRVLESAARVGAIITVSSGLTSAGQSSSEVQHAADVLRPLVALVRSARTAAVDAILRSAWQG